MRHSLAIVVIIYARLLLCSGAKTEANEGKSVSSKQEGTRVEASCILKPGDQRLSTLPGVGWDNLANEERGPTLRMSNYSKCQFSSDGRFLIPDDVLLEPRKSSDLELSSEVYESTTEAKSITAFSINSAVDVGASYYHMNGDFSFEKESLRGKSSATKGLLVRSQLRHHRYTVYLIPDSTLHPRFRNRLLDIAAHLERGNVSVAMINQFDKGEFEASALQKSRGVDVEDLLAFEESMRAFYLADLIVRDFGTHSINSVDVGGILVKTDTLDETSVQMNKGQREKLATSATATFASLLSVKGGMAIQANNSETESYSKHVTHSRIQSFGGPIFHAHDMSLADWENGLDSQLVAIDRSGSPIYELITSRSLPEMDEDLVIRLSKTLKSAVERYYTSNAVVGCMDPTSVFYDGNANVASSECTGKEFQPSKSARLPLGGLFQRCKGPRELCESVVFKNPATGDFSCPQGYVAVSLLPPQVRNCYTQCEPGTWARKSECHQECAVTEASWCALDPSLPELPVIEDGNAGFIFGGLYTDKEVNPVTQQYSCPEYSWPIAVGRHLRICLSTDRELGGRHSFPFGGFYSCRFGNPLATLLDQNSTSSPATRAALHTLFAQPDKVIPIEGRSSLYNEANLQDDYSTLFASVWPRRCPKGYTAHLAAVEDTCQIHFCVPANMLKGKQRRILKRPPFVEPPTVYRVWDSSGKEKKLNDVPTTITGAHGERLERLDGDWVRSAEDGFPNRFSALRDQKRFTIVLGCLLTAALVALIMAVTSAILLARRQRPHHPL